MLHNIKAIILRTLLIALTLSSTGAFCWPTKPSKYQILLYHGTKRSWGALYMGWEQWMDRM